MQSYENNELKQIQSTEFERDLEIQVSSNLYYTDEVSKASSKAYSVLGTLKRTYESRNKEIWKKLYTNYIKPHLDFAVSALNPCLKKRHSSPRKSSAQSL